MTKKTVIPVLICLLFAGTPCAFAEQAAPASSVQQADALYQKEDWAGAARVYEDLAKREPGNGRAWSRLGACRHHLGQLPQAIEAYRKAEAIGHNPFVMYNLATALALSGRRADALEWLDKAAQAGFAQAEKMESDDDLKSLKDEARFQSILEKVKVNEEPCAHLPEARQFDFWVGKWDVRTPAGDQAGTNTIDLVLGGCALIENWTDARGGTGKSLNLYDKIKGRWQQTWIDNQGDAIEFTDGEYKDGVLRFRAEKKQADGTTLKRRLSFFNLGPDKVRQFSEQSTDGGKTWTTEYDLTYNRIK
ncbi:MAG TPA: tetratricopeptide repeat protein [Candidatus Polarisedimenticolia bacterium]|nr:tetratricopeptide repeat protein [Candidatus Polarisedimenticolia bacterium]